MNGIIRRRHIQRKETTYWSGNITIRGNNSVDYVSKTILSASVLKPFHAYRIIWKYPHRYSNKAGWVIKTPRLLTKLPRNAAQSGNITLTTDESTDKALCVIAQDTYQITTTLTYQIYDLGPLSL